MARRLKQRPTSEADQVFHGFVGLTADKMVLESPRLCNLVIAALLSRTNKKCPKEARYLHRQVRLLASLEKLLPPSCEWAYVFNANQEPIPTATAVQAEQLAKGLLRSIVFDKVPRADHDKYTLLDQRKGLIKYFEDNPVSSSLSPRQYKTWLMKHGQHIHTRLSVWPCLCEYRASFDDITEHTLRNCRGAAQGCRGPGDLVSVILAELHRMTPQAVSKILKLSGPT